MHTGRMVISAPASVTGVSDILGLPAACPAGLGLVGVLPHPGTVQGPSWRRAP